MTLQALQQIDSSVGLYGPPNFANLDESIVSIATHRRALNRTYALPDVSLTLIICSNRISSLSKYWQINLASLLPIDNFLVVIDCENSAEVEALRAEMESYGVEVLVNNKNYGLSYSRNLALQECRTNYAVYIDDDVTIAKETIASIRQEFKKGYEIVGVRICPPSEGLTVPWYISQGQLHYLALHNPNEKAVSVWGACMALKLPFIRTFNFRFRDELGRKGKILPSGDDTTFLREMKSRGAKESMLNDVSVNHHIDKKRLSISYMARRAYWQGRSEVRRADVRNGVMKEWRRFLRNEGNGVKENILAVFYITAVLTGVIWEGLARQTPKATPRAERHATTNPVNEF